jgi:uncharacterized protein YehS (DUF1456 family)
MVEIFKLSGCSMTEPTLLKLLKKEEEEDCIECSNPLMTFFLDGLIVHLRGQRESGDLQSATAAAPLNNNVILKKLRIALNLKEADMIAIMGLAGITISKSELSALFRTSGHKHFKECGDQFLRNFLKGVTIRNRPGDVVSN